MHPSTMNDENRTHLINALGLRKVVLDLIIFAHEYFRNARIKLLEIHEETT